MPDMNSGIPGRWIDARRLFPARTFREFSEWYDKHADYSHLKNQITMHELKWAIPNQNTLEFNDG